MRDRGVEEKRKHIGTGTKTKANSRNEATVLTVGGEKGGGKLNRILQENARLSGVVREERWKRHQVEEVLRSVRRRITEFSDREKRRIGQELHDVLGQQLTGAGLITRSLQTRIENRDPGDLSEDLEELAKVIREAQTEVRRLARGLCAVRMDSRGLVVALNDLVDSTARRSEASVFLECDGCPFGDEERLANHLYHIAQEAVSNAVRYSGSDRIVVGLHTQNGTTVLEVRDNGKGMAEEGPGGTGMGLHIMRCRAETIGARLTVDSSPGRGTTVRCTVRERSPSP